MHYADETIFVLDYPSTKSVNSIDTFNLNASFTGKPLDDKQEHVEIPLSDYKSELKFFYSPEN